MAKVKVNANLDLYGITNGEFDEGLVLTVTKRSICGLSFKPGDYAGDSSKVTVKSTITASYEIHTIENKTNHFEDGMILCVAKPDGVYNNGIKFVKRADLVSSDDLVEVKGYLDNGESLNGKFKEGAILTVVTKTEKNPSGLAWVGGGQK